MAFYFFQDLLMVTMLNLAKLKFLCVFLVAAAFTYKGCSDHKDPVPEVPPEEISAADEIPSDSTAADSTATDTTATDTIAGDEGAFYEYKILPQETDTLIKKSDQPNYVYLDTRASLKNKLLVFLGGTNTSPGDFQQFTKTASDIGYHVINVNYLNSVTVRECENENMSCFTWYHDEIIFGGSQSDFVTVPQPDAIINRILKLLKHLHARNQAEGWDQFYTDTNLNWLKFVVAGHSQGGDHAAYIAYKYSVDRLIVLCSPNDYSRKYNEPASWLRETFATSPDRIYGLMHKRDEMVPPAEHYAAWKDMKMLDVADTSSADKATYKNFRALYTDIEPNTAADKYKSRHNAPVLDEAVPEGAAGDQIRLVWKHLLGG